MLDSFYIRVFLIWFICIILSEFMRGEHFAYKICMAQTNSFISVCHVWITWHTVTGKLRDRQSVLRRTSRANGLVRSTLLSRSRKACCVVQSKIPSRRLSSFHGISKGEGTRPFDLARRLVYMAHALLLGGLFLVLYFVACRPRKYTSCYTNLFDPECNNMRA